MLDKEKREILPTSITKSYVVRRLPTLVSLALVGVGWLLNEVALAWIHERVPRDTPPLPDLWFSWFPEVRGAIRITEYIMLILVVNTLVIIVTHQHRWVVSRRVFFCAALSYCFRALCITIFQVPVPSVHTYCAPKTNGSFYIVSARVARMFWSAGIEQLRPRELCGDLIVSGHTVTIFTSFYAFKYYAPKKLKPLSYMLNMLAFMAVIAILFARKHYTIDVVLGLIQDFYQDAFMGSKQWIEIVHVSQFTTILMEHSSPSCSCDEFTISSISVNGAGGFHVILVASSVRNTTSPPKRYSEKSRFPQFSPHLISIAWNVRYTVSTRVFMEYHALMLSYHEQSFEKNILSWSWWSRIVPYFEKDAPPPHAFHNRIEWPSSCPQKVRRRIV
ncbi:hypothetical protein Y032_0089g2264 [Ancylostoma ceylanicum]|nr:hypothetical protein Y032_0089g2264 [Ancylostoma ceylanicum]